MEFTLLHKTSTGHQEELRVCLLCTLSEAQDRVELTLTSANDMFFLYEVTMGPDDFRSMCTAFSYDFLHISSLPSVLQSDILPTLSNTPSIASVGTDICILETDSQLETATLQFLTVRPSLRVPFFSIQLKKGSDRSIARNISVIASQLEAKLNGELSALQLQIGRVEGEKVALESKLALAESSLRRLELRLQESTTSYEKRLSDLQKEKLVILDAKASVEAKLADALTDLSTIKSSTATHMSQISVSNEELQRANARISELERLALERERQHSEEVVRLKGEVDRLTGLLDTRVSEVTGNTGTMTSFSSTGSIQYTPMTSAVANAKEERSQYGQPTVRFSKDDDLTESSLSTNQTTVMRARSSNARNILAKYGISSTHSAQASTHANTSIPPKPTSINSLPVMQRLKQLELQAQAQLQAQDRQPYPVHGTTNQLAERLARYTGTSSTTSSASSSYSQGSLLGRGQA